MSLGFVWTSNSPYIRGMWVRVRRAPRAPALSTTVTDGFIDLVLLTGRTQRNANPAYMIYEILTNNEWGMGGATSLIDTANFQAVAATLKAEGFGLFMTWVQSETIENFVAEILDHIQAFLYLSPLTGLWTLTLLRADYDSSTLPVYGNDNANFTDFDRKLPGETINEIIVTWTNPITEKTETVGAQDLANIVQQGGQIVSQSRNYYGIRSSDLALKVAARDLRAASAPLASVKMKALRSAWATVPGKCVIANVPQESDYPLVMRVQEVDYGDRSDGYVTVTLLEDIFALNAPVYTGTAPTAMQPVALQPNPPAFVKLFTLPLFIAANAAQVFTTQPVDPEVNAGFLVADPNTDFLNYEPYTAVTLPNGAIVQQSVGTREKTGYWSTTTALVAEAFTTFAGFPGAIGSGPQLAGLVFIGGGNDDTTTEIALVQAIDASGNYTLARGVLDTIPRPWPVGTPVWFLNTQSIIDATFRSPSETVSYRPLMRTSVTLLPYASAVASTLTLTRRPYLPLRPANVQLNGQGFGVVPVGSGDGTVTWSNRNRLVETVQIIGWSAGSVTVETGQTTTVRVLKSDGTVAHAYTGLTGTSYVVPQADLSDGTAVQVASVNADGESLQAYVLSYDPPVVGTEDNRTIVTEDNRPIATG